jgi:hypothetical protein
MPCPFLTIDRLDNGIAEFRKHPRWRPDFHNQFYANVTGKLHQSGSLGPPSAGGYKIQKGETKWAVPNPSNSSLWDDIVDELSCWKALRPHRKSDFANVPGELVSAYSKDGPPRVTQEEPGVLPKCHPLKRLFEEAQKLKRTEASSAVFPSKLCHMLVPWEFPIWDNSFAGNKSHTREAMKNALEGWTELSKDTRKSIYDCLDSRPPDYWCYRAVIVISWDTASQDLKKQLKMKLDEAVLKSPMGKKVWENYPYRTKIPELCLA